MMSVRKLVILALVTFCLANISYGLELANIFGDHMVLQADKPIKVWGTSQPGQDVTVTFNNKTVTARADSDGNWSASLPPMSAGGPKTMDVLSDGHGITYRDILIGEVWLCSGQSNMEWPLDKSMHASQSLADAFDPELRLFLVERADLDAKPHDVNGRWVICDATTAASFSAVGYYFGRELRDELDAPVGLIANAWGGSSAEAWMSRERLLSAPEFAYMVESLPERRVALKQYNQSMRDWESAGRQGAKPPWPREVRQYKWATMLHDRMLKPLVPYTIRGVIWYQGEENASRAEQYRRLFPSLIHHWRSLWSDPDLPFLFVQLANFRARVDQPSESNWAELREAQLQTLSLPHTAMAVTIDIGAADDIHPRNKLDVGRRLALAARAKVYGQDVQYMGPTPEAVKVEGSTIRIRMGHVGEGLATSDGEEPKGFAIASEAGAYVWAKARIDGDSVVVWSEDVAEPAYVRYAWANNPQATLVNSYGLPASPFRTDKRAGVTQGAK